MKVLKFGGSSVQDAERIRNVVSIVKNDPEAKVVVCSALGGITDQLIATAKAAAENDHSYKSLFAHIEQRHINCVKELIDVRHQSATLAKVKYILNELEELLNSIFLLNEMSIRALDYVMSFGERLSCIIITEALREHGLQATYLDATQVIKTDGRYGCANVNFEVTNPLIREYVAKTPGIIVATGFIASAPNGDTVTLGRGGSDYTCSIFAAALKASVAEIWTDVDGVMTCDPRKVPQAIPIPALTYEEAMEMSHFGAKVIYPPTMVPAMRAGVPIVIRNTFNPAFAGTVISSEVPATGRPIKGITSISQIALLRVQGSGMVGVAGISARLFGALATGNISVILITQASSEHSICFAVKPEEALSAKQRIEKEFASEIARGLLEEVIVETDLSIIAIVGKDMRRTSGVAGRMFQALGHNGINVVAIAQGSSELNISAVVSKTDEIKALRALHQAFFESDTKTLNVFMAGTGLIGSTLLRQIQEQRAYLRQEYNIDFRIVGLANSRKMLINENGIPLDKWREELESRGQPSDIEQFVEQMNLVNLANSVFVDNTASAAVANVYDKVLQASISIVTPNKIANSSSYAQYARNRQLAKRHGVMMLYETNVGAGLPVISTLRDLINSGDKIIRIEAVLSGTLSYIFNTFDGSISFSQVVKQAKAKGYTEPDPRQDLSCKDVGRKILILARECGYAMEFEDITIDNFLPEPCMKAATVEEFFNILPNYDDYFEQLRRQAADKNEKLRVIARFEDGKATISLQSVGPEHPFASLSGADNIIAFTTMRYPTLPMVVKGSGAGAEVTAAGVFADLIRIANYL
ncbi:MAG: bifunctional aspartate kinase/homoserine dehydrogenase I [Cytophagales bacterium]|nr:bifunctional aspartate kinase/homoserine dehydrogenase I [Bernardetiaceae bacterium]MDW8209734.1 bifunctional aspartate kinase/homoserine dehydrogenase I [Cytophagales bacterium]